MIKVGNITIGEGHPLAFILGPCVMESEAMVLEVAAMILEVSPFPFIFKASFDKANRSSIHSFRGLGLEKGLEALARVKKELGIAVTTDIHLPEQAELVAEVCDLIQIPAFLCRQTDLLIAAAVAGKPVHVKKGQFVAPQDMKHVLAKIWESGNDQVLLTDRGYSFGYNNLVSDMRSIPIMKELGCPVCFDASHSIQLPGSLSETSGGDRAYLPTLARAAVAAGADAIFLETHPNPALAKSDAMLQWPLDALEPLLRKLVAIHETIRCDTYVS